MLSGFLTMTAGKLLLPAPQLDRLNWPRKELAELQELLQLLDHWDELCGDVRRRLMSTGDGGLGGPALLKALAETWQKLSQSEALQLELQDRAGAARGLACALADRLGTAAETMPGGLFREKRDLLAMVRFDAECQLPLTVDQISRAIVSLRMSKAGMFDDQPQLDVMVERLDAHFEQFHVDTLWQTFRNWTKESQERSDWLKMNQLKQKSVAAVTACTPDVITQSISELQELLDPLIAQKFAPSAQQELGAKTVDFLRKIRRAKQVPDSDGPAPGAVALKKLKVDPQPAESAAAGPHQPKTPAAPQPKTPAPGTPAFEQPAATNDILDLHNKDDLCRFLDATFREKDLESLQISIDEFTKIVAQFVEHLLETKPRNTSLSKHFRAIGRSRRKLLTFWQKEMRARFVSLGDVGK
ncbi:unnamed protein product [Durusdinium trenchii]|uniref:Uncharacterized protein n=1 Tax=Durusdinium trenchii TaxID=1381693 RepID=A0ABP0RMJ5_9DINO